MLSSFLLFDLLFLSFFFLLFTEITIQITRFEHDAVHSLTLTTPSLIDVFPIFMSRNITLISDRKITRPIYPLHWLAWIIWVETRKRPPKETLISDWLRRNKNMGKQNSDKKEGGKNKFKNFSDWKYIVNGLEGGPGLKLYSIQLSVQRQSLAWERFHVFACSYCYLIFLK
jgi:hypothetical protein